MSKNISPTLQVSTSPGASVAWGGGSLVERRIPFAVGTSAGFRQAQPTLNDAEVNGPVHFEIPASPTGAARPPYAIAQLDDYHRLPRRRFPWQPPFTLGLRARASGEHLPGTWGFGLWNDPFSFSVGLGGASRRFPALPNAAWFFYASPPNHLSFRDDLPAQGFLAATFRSPAIPAPLLAIAAPVLGLGLWPPAARLLRGLLRSFIRQDALNLAADVTQWHSYWLDWQAEGVSFSLDGEVIFTTPVSPRGPLALVLWIDNQYAALPPDGRLAFGSLRVPRPSWLEIEGVEITN